MVIFYLNVMQRPSPREHRKRLSAGISIRNFTAP